MLQTWKNWCWKLTISGAIIALSGNYAFAQSQIIPDSTLGTESSVVTPLAPGSTVDVISGGATRGSNLFHSFEQFSVPPGGTAYFNNALNIQNIISRVTGSSISTINGLIRANLTANLFLLNPNGIIFGPNARLDIGGSFVASTASSLRFADQTQFSATQPQATPLLTVSVPVGLQFGGHAGRIVNQSVAVNNSGILGLQVDTGKTLALVGGDVELPGGNLTAEAGRIELGSVAGPSLVSLKPTVQGWALGYEGVQSFRDIQLSQEAVVDASGNRGASGGNIQVRGRRVTLTDGSVIQASTGGLLSGGTLAVNASDSVELIGTTADGKVGSGLRTDAVGTGAAGNLKITTAKLIVQSGATVSTSTLPRSQGQGGTLEVNTSDSVELSGTGPNGKLTSGLFTQTGGAGSAGDLTIKTGRLIARDGARVSAGTGLTSRGEGGNLTVTADSVELVGSRSGLFAQTQGTGDAGELTISTGPLIVRDRAAVSVSSEGNGKAGDLTITARSIRLDNEAALSAASISGEKGRINLQVKDLLVLRRNSQISTKAGMPGTGGEGGNIIIDAPFIVAVASENSDILANAFRGTGGNAQIRAQDIFGTQLQQTTTPRSDITASGIVQLDTPTFIDPSRGLVTLPVELVDVAGLITPGCSVGGGGRGASQFIVTGRGGLPPTPREALGSEPALADLGTLVQGQENAKRAATSTNSISSQPAPLVEAQGWVIGSNGEVVLTAQAPTVTAHSPWLTPTTCHGS